MPNPANNPLFKHFRQPAIYLRLPSMGQFWDENSLDMPTNGEIPIYPMTVKDEITLKTPDALMNGAGVVSVIQSCCPNIKDAWKVPTVDLDPILIAIRAASYGSNMEITTKCPHCGEENENLVDLRILLDTLSTPDYSPVEIDGLIFNFKPQRFETMNSANLITFEQEKLVRAITDSNLDEQQKLEEFNKMFPKITDMNIMVIVNSIDSIVTEDGTKVSEVKFLQEFIHNCDRGLFDKIKQEIDLKIQQQKLNPVDILCSSCNTQYTSDLNFEQSNFFV